MPTRYDSIANDDWLLAGSPSGVRAQNMSQLDCGADLSALTTQVMLSVAVPLQAGDLVSNITFKSGATAANTPTNYWFALYDTASTPALVGQTADQTSTAWAANTVKTLALATPYRVPVTGVYYAAIMVKASAVPTLVGKSVGIAGAAASILSSKVLVQTSGSSLTDTAPATITSATTVATVPLAILT
jgi:hypothetical protein